MPAFGNGVKTKGRSGRGGRWRAATGTRFPTVGFRAAAGAAAMSGSAAVHVNAVTEISSVATLGLGSSPGPGWCMNPAPEKQSSVLGFGAACSPAKRSCGRILAWA